MIKGIAEICSSHKDCPNTLKVGGEIEHKCANVGIKLLDDEYPTPLYKKCID